MDSSTIYFCGGCKLDVRWNHKGVLCDRCNTWYHIDCRAIPSADYSRLGHSSAAWECTMCNETNYTHITDAQPPESYSNSNPFKALDNHQETEDNTTTSIDSLESIADNGPMPIKASSPLKIPAPRFNNERPLRVLNVNCQSLTSKIGPWIELLDRTKPDVLIATETWLHSGISDNELCLDSYVVYRRDRVHSKGGGILIAVSEYISSKDISPGRPSESTHETLWVNINNTSRKSAGKSLIIGACYRPSVADSTTIGQMKVELQSLSAKSEQNILLAGDFNLPGIVWKTQSIAPKAQYVNHHTEFLDVMNDFSLEQMIEEPTRMNAILDLVLTNHPHRISRPSVIPGISDHDAVYVEFAMGISAKLQKPREIKLYRKADWDGLRGYLKPLEDELSTQSSVEFIWQQIKERIEKAASKFIPTKLCKRQETCPWIDSSLRRLIKRRNRIFKRTKATGTIESEEEYQKLKREVQRRLRSDHNEYITTILSDGIDGPTPNKRFWTYIKHKQSNGNSIQAIKKDDAILTSAVDKANALNSQFQSVFSTLVGVDENLELPSNNRRMSAITISREGVLKQLMRLKTTKAQGPDGLHPRVLKEAADCLCGPLTLLFQQSLDTGAVPGDWKRAAVCPIYKKGDRSDPANYRPVSLTCILSKVMEHIITSSLMRHADNTGWLVDEQHGFRAGRSCETQLVELTGDISRAMDKGTQVDAIVLDFSKAFDKVNHHLLVKKLASAGVDPLVCRWIESFLSDRTQKVVIESEESEEVKVTSGVPQGSVIGPALFLYYINDLPRRVKSKVRLFADDTIIYADSRDHVQLQQDLLALEKWERDWCMEFHPKKCNLISFTLKKQPTHTSYSLHGHTLERVRNVKYLGVTLQDDLRWHAHTDNLCSKAYSRVGFIRRAIPSNCLKLRETAYRALIRPILEYASSAWDCLTATDSGRLEMVQRRAARMVCNAWGSRTSVTGLLHRLSWPSLDSRRADKRLHLFRSIHFQTVSTVIGLYLNPKTSIRSSRSVHDQAYEIPHSKTNRYRDSFFPATARNWNVLKPGNGLLLPPTGEVVA